MALIRRGSQRSVSLAGGGGGGAKATKEAQRLSKEAEAELMDECFVLEDDDEDEPLLPSAASAWRNDGGRTSNDVVKGMEALRVEGGTDS